VLLDLHGHAVGELLARLDGVHTTEVQLPDLDDGVAKARGAELVEVVEGADLVVRIALQQGRAGVPLGGDLLLWGEVAEGDLEPVDLKGLLALSKVREGLHDFLEVFERKCHGASPKRVRAR
jgi:hypothetical protein